MIGCVENTIRDQFRFTITTPRETFEAKPINDKLEWEWTRENGFPRLTLKTKLVFSDSKQNDSLDFTKLYGFERRKERCEKFYIEIERFYKEVPALFYRGFFRVVDCDWDVGLKRCEAEIQPLDPYTCIIENWDERFNPIDYADPVHLDAYIGERRVETCYRSFYVNQRLNPRYPDHAPYMIADDCEFVEVSTHVSTRIEYIRYNRDGTIFEQGDGPRTSGSGTIVVPTVRPPGGQGPGPGRIPVRTSDWLFKGPEFMPYQYFIETDWAFDYVEGAQPPGDGWVPYDNGWARPSISHTYTAEDGERITEPMFIDGIDGAYNLNEVIQGVLQDYCGENIISNFYGISPDGTNPDNKYYLNAGDEMEELYIVPKSEIINYGAATRASEIFDRRKEQGYTFKSFLDDLRTLHNVMLRWDGDAGVFRLEHESYFKHTYRIDLTQEKYNRFIRGNFHYQYFKPKMPKTEEWDFQEETDADFDTSLIRYENCLFDTDSKEVYSLTGIVNNIEALYVDGFKEDPKHSLDGFAVVATKDRVVSIGQGEISGSFRLNASQSLPALIQKYHTFKRPQNEGEWNNIILYFDNAYEIREIENTVRIPLSDIEKISIDDYAKTQLNWGIIESMDLICPENHFKIKTHHK